MKKLIPALLGMACGAALFKRRGLKEVTQRERRLAEIEAFHVKDQTAALAKDVHTLRDLWTDDCVLLPPGRLPIVGKEAVWAYIQEQNEELEGVEILEYRQEFKEVTLAGEWAFEWGVFKGAAQPSGEDVQYTRAKLFRVLRRQPSGTWKVARSIWHDDPGDLDYD
jgi:ketosteroid isomerase-like protein